MSSNGKKKQQSKAVTEEKVTSVPEKKPINLKRNIAIIAVFVVLAAAALAAVYYIASSHGADNEPTTPPSPSDAGETSSLPEAGYELVEYRDGKLPMEFVYMLNAAEEDSIAANNQYGTALTIDGEKISVPEFLLDYCDTYAALTNETAQTLASTGINKIGFDISKVPSEQSRTGGELWSDEIAVKTAGIMQETRRKFYAAISAGFVLEDEETDNIYNQYLYAVNYAVSEGRDIDDLLAENYGEGITYNIFAARTIMDVFGTLYLNSIAKDVYDSCTEEELQESFAADPTAYYNVDVRIFPLEDPKYDQTTAASIKSEKDFLEFAEQVNGQYYEGYDANANTMYYGASYEEINNKFGGDVAAWIFDGKRGAGDYGISKGAIYKCAVLILKPRYLGSSIDARGFFIPFSSSDDAAATEDEINATKEKAKGYYNDWIKGDKTEESFAAICDEFFREVSETEDGGMMDDVRKSDDMDTGVLRWCFDAKRKPGDCEMIENDTGVMLIYFIGKNDDDLDWKDSCKSKKAEATKEAKLAEIIADSTYGFRSKGKEEAIRLGDEYAVRRIAMINEAANGGA